MSIQLDVFLLSIRVSIHAQEGCMQLFGGTERAWEPGLLLIPFLFIYFSFS